MYESSTNYPASLFDQLERMRRELDDAFSTTAPPSSIRSVAPGTLPGINVGRTPTSVEVFAFLPGVDGSKIEVTFDRGVLRISGERPSAIAQQDDKRVHVYMRERRSGRFTRVIAVRDDVDSEQMEAHYRNGVLHVRLHLREAARPQRITVQ